MHSNGKYMVHSVPTSPKLVFFVTECMVMVNKINYKSRCCSATLENYYSLKFFIFTETEIFCSSLKTIDYRCGTKNF